MARTARRLTRALAGGPLVRADLRWPSLGDVDLRGRRSLGTASYGKHLLTRLDDGSTLHSHLRMEGNWVVDPTAQAAQRRGGDDVRAVLATSTWTAWGKRLGMMDLIRTRDEPRLLGHLGPDLMAPDAEDTLAGAAERMTRDRRGIGEVLLDQTVAAGIGTIWTSETLFRHGISPWRTTSEVDGAAVLTTASRLMRAAAAAPSFPAREQDSGRQDPVVTNAVRLGVYDREHQPCPRCGTPVRRGMVGQAPTARRIFYCPTCQGR